MKRDKYSIYDKNNNLLGTFHNRENTYMFMVKECKKRNIRVKTFYNYANPMMLYDIASMLNYKVKVDE